MKLNRYIEKTIDSIEPVYRSLKIGAAIGLVALLPSCKSAAQRDIDDTKVYISALEQQNQSKELSNEAIKLRIQQYELEIQQTQLADAKEQRLKQEQLAAEARLRAEEIAREKAYQDRLDRISVLPVIGEIGSYKSHSSHSERHPAREHKDGFPWGDGLLALGYAACAVALGCLALGRIRETAPDGEAKVTDPVTA